MNMSTINVLVDGTAVLIRPALPEDAAGLERMFYRLSPDTIYFYTFVPVPRQPQWAARLGALARVDGVDHYALVALVDGEIVGVARYDRGAVEREVRGAAERADTQFSQAGLAEGPQAPAAEGAVPEEAEFAIVIEDAWQRRGLGKLLMTRLIVEASRHEVRTFTARILGENRRALRLVAALFANVQACWDNGECLVRSPLSMLRPVA